MAETTTRLKNIVIVGGGFGGVRLANRISQRTDVQVTLVSDRDYFAYYPQLYHAATGGARSQSALPLGELFAGSRVAVVIDAMTDLDKVKQQVVTTKQRIDYDYVVLALGNVTNYFGIEGLEQYSYNIKTIDGAEKFKRHLHTQLVEDAKPEAHYVVVGAGPTGVELASALSGYLRRIVRLHGITAPTYKIDLVEASPRVMPRSTEAVSKRVQKRLQKLGVNVMTAAKVEGETAAGLKLNGETLKTQTVIWTAGVATNPFYKQHPDLFQLAKNGRVIVDEHLQATDNIYVIGDNAATPYGGLAQTAVSDSDFVASNLINVLQNSSRSVYKPKRPITVVPVGPRWAVVEWGSLHLYGWIGGLLRHAADLIAYHDIERWGPALRVWMQQRRRDDQCEICQSRP